MAKKLPQTEQPYEPVKAALVQSVLLRPRALESEQTASAAEEPQPPRVAPLAANGDAREPPAARAQARETLLEQPSQPRAVEAPKRAHVAPSERLDREKRCLLTRVEESELERLVSRIAQELNTPVKFSHVLRAAMQVIRHAEEEILDEARKMGPVARPSNSDATRLAEFELRLARLLATALRKAPPLRD